MAYMNFIAAIDLGTSHIAGMIGTKNADGALTIIAYESSINTTKCIRRGCIYNVDEAAFQIKTLITKLNNKLPPGEKIDKVYVGVGGQSIRSMEHVVTRSLGLEGVVTSDTLRDMEKECRAFKPEMLDVLSIVSPVYLLDGKLESNPEGISCNRIDARYKLIVGRPSLRRNIITCIKEKVQVDIAGIFISPLVLADTVLHSSAKELGCVLVSIGAGVTSVSVYRNNELISLNVIPLGGNLVTRDIMSLNILETEAERLKKAHGNVLIDETDDSEISVNVVENLGSLRQIKLKEFNTVVEARMQEIVENVYARVKETGLLDSLGAGIIMTGGASSIKNLDVLLKGKFGKNKCEVRMAAIQKGLIEKSMLTITDPDYAVIGLLLKGKINCAYIPPVAPPPPPPPPPVDPPVVEEDPIIEQPKPSKSKFSEIMKSITGAAGSLFDDEEMGTISKDNKKKKR